MTPCRSPRRDRPSRRLPGGKLDQNAQKAEKRSQNSGNRPARESEARTRTMQHVGIIGFPVAHSLSPRMQQAAFDACGIDAHYALWETAPADLSARIAGLRAPEMLGANVTIPHK